MGLEGLGGPHRGPGGAGSPCRRAGSGWEVHPECRERLGGSPGGPANLLVNAGEVGNPSQSSSRGREAHPEVWERLGGPPEGLEGVGRPSLRAGSGWEALPGRGERSGGSPGGPANLSINAGGFGTPFRRSVRARMPTCRSGSGREATLRSGRGQKDLLVAWMGSVGPP